MHRIHAVKATPQIDPMHFFRQVARIVAGISAISLACTCANAAPGSVDRTFGESGFAATPALHAFVPTTSVRVDKADGVFLFAIVANTFGDGYVSIGSDRIAKFDAAGMTIQSFGSNSVLQLPVNLAFRFVPEIKDLVVLEGNRFQLFQRVFGGSPSQIGSNYNFVDRLQSDGRPDLSYGDSGHGAISYEQNGHDVAFGNGSLVRTNTQFPNSLQIFGTSGASDSVATERSRGAWPALCGLSPHPLATPGPFMPAADGDLVMIAPGDDTFNSLCLAKMASDGTYRSSFGNAGALKFDGPIPGTFNGSGQETGGALSFYYFRTDSFSGARVFRRFRLTANGQFFIPAISSSIFEDVTMDDAGLDPTSLRLAKYDGAVVTSNTLFDSKGRFVSIAKRANNASGAQIVVRWLANGTRDTAFGANGFATIPAILPSGAAFVASDIREDSLGRLLVGGAWSTQSGANTVAGFAVLRLEGDTPVAPPPATPTTSGGGGGGGCGVIRDARIDPTLWALVLFALGGLGWRARRTVAKPC